MRASRVPYPAAAASRFGAELHARDLSAASAVEDFGHLVDLHRIVPSAARSKHVAREKVAYMQAMDGSRQHLDIHLLANHATGLQLREGLHHGLPNALLPQAGDGFPQFFVLKQLDVDRSRQPDVLGDCGEFLGRRVDVPLLQAGALDLQQRLDPFPLTRKAPTWWT